MLLLLLLAAGAGALYWYEPGGLRSNREAAAIEVLGPSGRLDALPRACRWQPIAGARLYQLTVFDAAGNVLGTSYTNRISAELSPAVRSRLQPGRTYFWQVVATDAAGQVVGSSKLTRLELHLAGDAEGRN